ncbi:unnamed protein product [Linum trigynum]|uniref:Uncharacterized protein n=1 Tax=Linum trigynum TaxID=586398 RepID=A0AAV2CU84_9ROSI
MRGALSSLLVLCSLIDRWLTRMIVAIFTACLNNQEADWFRSKPSDRFPRKGWAIITNLSRDDRNRLAFTDPATKRDLCEMRRRSAGWLRLKRKRKHLVAFDEINSTQKCVVRSLPYGEKYHELASRFRPAIMTQHRGLQEDADGQLDSSVDANPDPARLNRYGVVGSGFFPDFPRRLGGRGGSLI